MTDSGQTAEVCLVDDDTSVLKSMIYLLASDGIKVRAFNKPEEFLAGYLLYRRVVSRHIIDS